MTVIFHFLRKAVCQARESAHPHAHREVLALNKASRNMLRVWIPADCCSSASDARHRTVAAFIQARRHAVYLYEHAVINITAKGIFHGININAVTVRSELEAV